MKTNLKSLVVVALLTITCAAQAEVVRYQGANSSNDQFLITDKDGNQIPVRDLSCHRSARWSQSSTSDDMVAQFNGVTVNIPFHTVERVSRLRGSDNKYRWEIQLNTGRRFKVVGLQVGMITGIASVTPELEGDYQISFDDVESLERSSTQYIADSPQLAVR